MDDDQVEVASASLRLDSETHRVIKGRRWRVSDPALDGDLRQALVNALMDARRAVKGALADDDEIALAAARSRVGDAKVALGERGPKWWEPMSEDDVALRVESGLRTLRTVGETELDFNELRRRFLL